MGFEPTTPTLASTTLPCVNGREDSGAIHWSTRNSAVSSGYDMGRDNVLRWTAVKFRELW